MSPSPPPVSQAEGEARPPAGGAELSAAAAPQPEQERARQQGARNQPERLATARSLIGPSPPRPSPAEPVRPPAAASAAAATPSPTPAPHLGEAAALRAPRAEEKGKACPCAFECLRVLCVHVTVSKEYVCLPGRVSVACVQAGPRASRRAQHSDSAGLQVAGPQITEARGPSCVPGFQGR
ncbi:uncharacterized protein LOC129558879 [Moschus berezovskii]|uniref:uncharacterized protein LOC129558879 n=1 Tax=Moschus berezovskii TaxID=68408 RepID=UPI00244380A5|nr:uncharacterized protein LOC129558879 [Moschus berezovskii]